VGMWGQLARVVITAAIASAGIAGAAEEFTVTIQRQVASASCVRGTISVNGAEIGKTIELPWKENKNDISCIPAGTYEAMVRYDKKDHWRLQLKDVPGNRTGVQIHVGNHTSEIEGCVLVGTELSKDMCSIAPGKSGPAYSELRRRFYGSDEPTSTPDKKIVIEIRSPIEGTWDSTDQAKRWRFIIKGTKLTWIERSGNDQLPFDVKIDSMATEFSIQRPNDDMTLKFLGFSDDMRREILRKDPRPSYMIITAKDDKLTVAWSGLSATKDDKGKFKELRQPGSTPAKQFSLERAK
jgi:hypothetical protein